MDDRIDDMLRVARAGLPAGLLSGSVGATMELTREAVK
jgi:hypothetical protein